MNIVRGILGVGVSAFGIVYLIAFIVTQSPTIERYYVTFHQAFSANALGVTLGVMASMVLSVIFLALFFGIVFLSIYLGFLVATWERNERRISNGRDV